MSKQFLDITGVGHLWGKIKAIFATKSELSNKQDKLVSGDNIKTIDGETLLGKGDISIPKPDLSNYYTKSEVNGKIQNQATPNIESPTMTGDIYLEGSVYLTTGNLEETNILDVFNTLSTSSISNTDLDKILV